MKIAQVVCVFPPYKGGMGNVAFHYSWELAKLGHEVVVFTPHYRSRNEQFKNFTIRSVVPWFRYGHGSFLPQLFWELRKFDIIHLHYPFFGGALPVILLKMLKPKKTKLITTYHMDNVGSGYMGAYFRFHAKYLLSGMVKLSDKVIVTSRDYADSSNLSKYLGKHPDKFIEIPLGADTWLFKPEVKDRELMRHHRICPQDKIILFVAALDRAHYFKGLSYLMEALESIDDPKVKLLIVGRGELREVYEKQAIRLGLKNRVQFVGYVSDHELPKYYNLCDLFVLPSTDRSEAFGLVFTEAMACGKPVIGTNLNGVRTVVEDGVNGFLVEPKDVFGLAKKIKIVLNDEELRRKMGQSGLVKVENKYIWRSIAKQLDDLYKKIKEND